MSTSKTSARSSIEETLRAFLKRSAESATAFAHKYRLDVFYRTELNVIALSVGFTLLLLILVLVTLSVLHEDVLSDTVSKIVESTSDGALPAVDSGMLLGELQYAKERSMLVAGTAVLVIAAVFGYLITRLSLRPARNALFAQKQFVSNIAHELRTPLAIIKTNTEVALMNSGLKHDLKDTLQSNVEELDRISTIINNLLSMNMLLRPGKITMVNVDLAPVVDQVKSALTDLASEKNIHIESEMSAKRTVWGNALGVEQIIMNIVKNALNFSPSGSRIAIRVEPSAVGQVSISVSDQGPGITDAELEKIFEPFYRGDSSRNRKSGGGSGLGLAIVNELVKIHKGRILVKSTVGRGTTVTVHLPKGHGLIEEKKPIVEAAPGEITMDFSRK